MEDLYALLVPVLRDLGASEVGHPRLVSAAEDHGRSWLEPNALLFADHDGLELLNRATDVVQEYVIEELWVRGSNWPPCPHHPDTHPMDPLVHEKAVWWVCPRGGGPVTEVGRLGDAMER